MRPLALFVLTFGPMLLEARLASRHARALAAAGAVEPRGDVYAWMQVAYPGGFLAMLAEGWWRGAPPGPVIAAGTLVFALGKGLKYWAIATLGPRWTFRVLVPPGSARTLRGPYRYMRHPNYVGVVGELIGIALLAPAPVTGPAALLLFGGLMLRRIAVEDAALRDSH